MHSTRLPHEFQRPEQLIWAALHGGEVQISESRPEATLTFGQLLDADARWLSLPPHFRKRRRRLSWRLAVASVISNGQSANANPPPPDISNTTGNNANTPRVGRNGRVLRKRGGR